MSSIPSSFGRQGTVVSVCPTSILVSLDGAPAVPFVPLAELRALVSAKLTDQMMQHGNASTDADKMRVIEEQLTEDAKREHSHIDLNYRRGNWSDSLLLVILKLLPSSIDADLDLAVLNSLLQQLCRRIERGCECASDTTLIRYLCAQYWYSSSVVANVGHALLQSLLRAGCSPDVRDSTGRTPLLHLFGRALSTGQDEWHSMRSVFVLLEHGADIDAADRKGNTVMHRLKELSPARQLELRLSGWMETADIKLRNEDGRTPLQVAKDIGSGPNAKAAASLLSALQDYWPTRTRPTIKAALTAHGRMIPDLADIVIGYMRAEEGTRAEECMRAEECTPRVVTPAPPPTALDDVD